MRPIYIYIYEYANCIFLFLWFGLIAISPFSTNTHVAQISAPLLHTAVACGLYPTSAFQTPCILCTCLYSAYPHAHKLTHVRTHARRYTRIAAAAAALHRDDATHRKARAPPPMTGPRRAPADPYTQRPDGRRRWIVVCSGGSGQAPGRRCENPKTVKSVAGR